MFQLSLSTILTSPTTPGAGFIPALSGDFSAALAEVAEASVGLPPTDGAPLAPRQGDAETGKSLPIPAAEGETNDPALAWLDNGAALVAASGAWPRPLPETPPHQAAAITPSTIGNAAAPTTPAKDAAPPVAIPVPAAAPVVPMTAVELPTPPSPDDVVATQPITPMAEAARPGNPAPAPAANVAVASAPVVQQPVAADRIATVVEAPHVTATSPIVVAVEPPPASTKGGNSTEGVIAGTNGRHRAQKHAKDASRPATLIDAAAILPGTPPAADPLPPATSTIREARSSAAARIGVPAPLAPPDPNGTSPAPTLAATNSVAEPSLPTPARTGVAITTGQPDKPSVGASIPTIATALDADHAPSADHTPVANDAPARTVADGIRTASASGSLAIAMPVSAPDDSSSTVVPTAPIVSPGLGRVVAQPGVSAAPVDADHPRETQLPHPSSISAVQADAEPARPITAASAPRASQPSSPATAAAPGAPAPIMAPTSTLPAAPVDHAPDAQPSVTRLAANDTAKADAPAPAAASFTVQPARPAPVPQPVQPAAVVLGVAFGGVIPVARPLGAERPSPREQALQALTALAGAAPAAPIAAAAQAQHGALDMRRDDWPQAMIDHIEALRDAADATSTRISLAPDALGKIDLSIRHDGNTVHVHFAAEAAQTRAILADAQPKLADLAQQRGFRLGQATVDAGASDGGQRQQSQSAAPPPQRPASAFTATTVEAVADPTRLA